MVHNVAVEKCRWRICSHHTSLHGGQGNGSCVKMEMEATEAYWFVINYPQGLHRNFPGTFKEVVRDLSGTAGEFLGTCEWISGICQGLGRNLSGNCHGLVRELQDVVRTCQWVLRNMVEKYLGLARDFQALSRHFSWICRDIVVTF